MKKYILFTLLIFSFTAQCLERRPLVQNILAKDIDYHGYLASNNHKYISYSEFYLNELKNNSKHLLLRDSYLLGQNFYYQKKFYMAKVQFLKVLALNRTFHIDEHGQEIVKKSLYKLIELSSNKENINSYKQSLAFNTINESTKTWTFPEKLYEFNTLIISGKITEVYPGKVIPIPDDEFLFTLISNKLKPIIKRINYQKLKKWQPDFTWLNTSNCQVAQKEVNLLPVYFSDDCVVDPNIKSQKIIAVKDLIPQDIAKPAVSTNYQVIKKKWYKNKWIWIGAGVVTTSLVLMSNRNKTSKPSNQPTVKTGF